MGKIKSHKGQLGRTIMRKMAKTQSEFIPVTVEAPKFLKTENNIKPTQKDLRSIVEQDALTEYLQVAQLQTAQFESIRDTKVNPEKIEKESKEVIIDKNAILRQAQKRNIFEPENNELIKNLRIPRKPQWNTKMTVKELTDKESDAFLAWRRNLAKVEEENYTIHLTPYEKNVEVWKQLWRVVEKSDIIVQIVDGRDPTFYHCIDVDFYVKEVDPRKETFLLINKSDLLSDEIRSLWNKHFLSKNVNHMFFSAKIESEQVGVQQSDWVETNYQVNSTQIVTGLNLLQALKKLVDSKKEKEEKEKQNPPQNAQSNKEPESEDLIDQWEDASEESDDGKGKQGTKSSKGKKESKLEGKQVKVTEQVTKPKEEDKNIFVPQPRDPNLVCIGFVGYPNVGKSSIINALVKKKLVGVAQQPGKTKNFQTIFLEKHLLLCDCPGLIFPNAASTRAEMVCNGVLPIDTIKDHISPIQLLLDRIPKIVFEKLYSLKFDVENPSASYFLSLLGTKKGYYTGRGLPEESKCSKLVLKDFVCGKLLYCKIPAHLLTEGQKVWQSNHLGGSEFLEREVKQSEEGRAKKEKEDVLDEELKESDDLNNLEKFDNDDLVQLMEGKRVKGVKLNKEQRREIKFQLNRGERVQFEKYLIQKSKAAQGEFKQK